MIFPDSDALVNSIGRLSDSQRLEFVQSHDFVGVVPPFHETSRAEREATLAFRLSRDGSVSSDVWERLTPGSPVFDEWLELRWLETEILIAGMVWALEAKDQDYLARFHDGYTWIARAVSGQPG